MQFALARTPDLATLATALRNLDPRATLALDVGNGVLDVTSTATPEQVLATLQANGHEATPLERELHVSGGSTCCGGCN